MAQGAAEGIAEGVGEGLGTIANQLRYNQAERKAERDRQADQIASQMKEVAQNIVRVGGRDKPEAAPLLEQLNTLSRQHNALYPAHETPALLQRLRTLTGNARNAPVPDPRANASADAAIATATLPEYRTTKAGQLEQAGTAGEIEGLNNDVLQKIKDKNNEATIAWAQKHGVAPDVLADLQATLAGVPATLLKPQPDKSGQWEPISGTINGTRTSLMHSRATNALKHMDDTPTTADELSTWVPDPKFAPVHNKQAWIMRDNKPLSVMLDANNHPVPGSENPDAVPPPSLFGRITTTDYITDDGFGNLVSIPKTTTSTPIGIGGAAPPNSVPLPSGAPATPQAAPAAGGGAGIPKTPAEARGLLSSQRPAGPTVVGSKASKPYQAAKVDYDKAAGIVSLAKAAAAKKDALSDRNLAIRMAREASGRFSMAEYDTMIKNAGLGNTFEQWMNNISSGALPDNIRNQLISVADDNLNAAKAELDSASGAATSKPGAVIKYDKNGNRQP